MKSLRLVGLVLAISLLAAPAAAGTLGIFFDEAGTVDNMYFERGVPFKVHVIMYEMEDIAGGVEFKLLLPPELVILNHEYNEGAWPFYYEGRSDLGAAHGVQIGLGDCYWMGSGINEPFKVATLTCFSPVDIMGGSIVLDGFPGPNGDLVPRYSQCPSVELFQLATTNATFQVSVGTENGSWGSVKALFAE